MSKKTVSNVAPVTPQPVETEPVETKPVETEATPPADGYEAVFETTNEDGELTGLAALDAKKRKRDTGGSSGSATDGIVVALHAIGSGNSVDIAYAATVARVWGSKNGKTPGATLANNIKKETVRKPGPKSPRLWESAGTPGSVRLTAAGIERAESIEAAGTSLGPCGAELRRVLDLRGDARTAAIVAAWRAIDAKLAAAAAAPK